jgi:hypothetical protein
MLLASTVRRDLRDDPNGLDLSLNEAATLLDVAPGKIAQAVLDGVIGGVVESQRVVSVSRRDIARLLRRSEDAVA